MRALERPDDLTRPDLRALRSSRGGAVELPLDVIRGIVRPDSQHMVKTFLELPATVGPEIPERLRIRSHPGTDAEQQPAVHEVVDHGNLARRHDRVVVGQREHAGAEHDPRAAVSEARDEGEARGDRLRAIRQVLADERFAEAERVGQGDRLTVLAQDFRVTASRGMDGLDKKSELQRHGGLL